MARVQKVVDPLLAVVKRLGLRQLVVVMRKGQIVPAPVHVHLRAQQRTAQAHNQAKSVRVVVMVICNHRLIITQYY